MWEVESCIVYCKGSNYKYLTSDKRRIPLIREPQKINGAIFESDLNRIIHWLIRVRIRRKFRTSYGSDVDLMSSQCVSSVRPFWGVVKSYIGYNWHRRSALPYTVTRVALTSQQRTCSSDHDLSLSLIHTHTHFLLLVYYKIVSLYSLLNLLRW